MKKNIILTIVFVIGIFSSLAYVSASEYTRFSSGFKKHFKDCNSYQETVESSFEGKSFKTQREIVGWRNGACKYIETVSSGSEAYRLNCMFPDLQVDELYKSMKDKSKTSQVYNLDLFELQKDPKTGKESYNVVGNTTIRGNNTFITWAKYQNNPYFCRSEKLK